MTAVLDPSAQSAPIQGVLDPISCDARDFRGLCAKRRLGLRPDGGAQRAPRRAVRGRDAEGVREGVRRAGRVLPRTGDALLQGVGQGRRRGSRPALRSPRPQGQDIELQDAEAWPTYYVSRSSATSERGSAITEAAAAEGIRPTKALEVAENPTALRAAILADPLHGPGGPGRAPRPGEGGPGAAGRAGP